MKIHPAAFVVGMFVFLVVAFAVLMKIAAGDKPRPKTGRELYLEQKIEREKSPQVRQMELDDQLQQEREGRPISGPQDNRGYSDE